jgi:hypothetical protein
MEILKRAWLVLFLNRVHTFAMFNLRPILFLVAACFTSFTAVNAGPLTEARVTKIINKVQVVDPVNGAHSAALQETIKDEIELKTGLKSRSELLFQDNTLTRIGPETSFSFKAGTREMSLDQGTILLQVPKGLGGAKIRTAAVTAAITGTTILMEYTPGKHIKVLVLEGSLRLSANGPFGNSVILRPGRMVLMRPDAKRIPAPVSVDLKRIVRTSSLVNMSKKSGAKLPSDVLITQAIAQQEREKGNSSLVDTGLVIHGTGTVAMNSTGEIVDVLARTEQGRSLTLAAISPANSHNGSTPGPTPAPTPVVASSPAPTPVAGASPVANPLPQPTPLPSPSGSDDGNDKEKGDHNGDGHADNGKGKDQTKKGHAFSAAPPALDSLFLSSRAQTDGTRRQLVPSNRDLAPVQNLRAP